jgi:hypothetical protein
LVQNGERLMEITTVKYRTQPTGVSRNWTGGFTVVEGGIVLLLSPKSQLFVPFHMIDCIEQSFTDGLPQHEVYNKSLNSRFRRK